MARSKVKVVLDRTNFSDEVLKRAVKPVMDDVQDQVEGMAAVDPASKVYRNEGFSGFYKGLMPRMMYVTPLVAIQYSCYQLFRKSLGLKDTMA